MFHSTIQKTHSNSVAKIGKPDTTSPLFSLASVSAEMLEYDDRETIPALVHETVSTAIQDLGPKIKILTVDIEVPSKEMSPPQDS